MSHSRLCCASNCTLFRVALIVNIFFFGVFFSELKRNQGPVPFPQLLGTFQLQPWQGGAMIIQQAARRDVGLRATMQG